MKLKHVLIYLNSLVRQPIKHPTRAGDYTLDEQMAYQDERLNMDIVGMIAMERMEFSTFDDDKSIIRAEKMDTFLRGLRLTDDGVIEVNPKTLVPPVGTIVMVTPKTRKGNKANRGRVAKIIAIHELTVHVDFFTSARIYAGLKSTVPRYNHTFVPLERELTDDEEEYFDGPFGGPTKKETVLPEYFAEASPKSDTAIQERYPELTEKSDPIPHRHSSLIQHDKAKSAPEICNVCKAPADSEGRWKCQCDQEEDPRKIMTGDVLYMTWKHSGEKLLVMLIKIDTEDDSVLVDVLKKGKGKAYMKDIILEALEPEFRFTEEAEDYFFGTIKPEAEQSDYDKIRGLTVANQYLTKCIKEKNKELEEKNLQIEKFRDALRFL